MQHNLECPHCGKSLQVDIEEIPLLQILTLVALHYNVPLSLLCGRSQKAEIAKAREAYFLLASTYTKSSLKEIGALVDRAYSTVIKDKQAFQRELRKDLRLQEKYTVLENKILMNYSKVKSNDNNNGYRSSSSSGSGYFVLGAEKKETNTTGPTQAPHR